MAVPKEFDILILEEWKETLVDKLWGAFIYTHVPEDQRCKRCTNTFFWKGCPHCGNTFLNRDILRQTY